MAWSSWALYCYPPNTAQILLIWIVDPCHCEVTEVVHAWWRFSPNALWLSPTLWSAWFPLHSICWSNQWWLRQILLKVMGLTGRWPNLAMGHLVMGLTWLALGLLSCLQADSYDRFCKTSRLPCRFQAIRLLIATSTSYWQFLGVLHGQSLNTRGLSLLGMTILVPQRISLPITHSSPHTGMYCLCWSPFQFPSLMYWRSSTNSLSSDEASSISDVVCGYGITFSDNGFVSSSHVHTKAYFVILLWNYYKWTNPRGRALCWFNYVHSY